MPKKKPDSTQDLISQAEAARLRDVSRASISELIKRGRLTTIVIAGKVLVRRSEVLNFKELKPGRPMSKK
jgi:hypothetical protein